MIPRHLILNVLLTIIATATALDTDPPVFTYCPKCLKSENILTQQKRVVWRSPTATDNSGVTPTVRCIPASGTDFPVPSTSNVRCTAKDAAGNEAKCDFQVILKNDQVPPVFTYCPADIIRDDLTQFEERINWNLPSATDNSGVLPSVHCSRQPGDIFAVPGSYQVICTAQDSFGNEATCSFRISLKRKQCPLYVASQNGALACVLSGSERVCAAMCRNPYDFVFNPPLLYYCSGGQWKFWNPLSAQTTLPWPACTGIANPSSIKTRRLPGYFFDGDANDPNVQNTIRKNFITLATGPYVLPLFCKDKPEDCTADKIEVYAGAFIDEVPPVITYCPANITLHNLTETEFRVNWNRPSATDDSGATPTVQCSRQSGDLFAVPSLTEVVCRAADQAGNVATCSFKISLKKKTCPLYAPPKNGALACHVYGTDRVCIAMCQDGFDFVVNPPLMYFCQSGSWQFWGIPRLFPYSSQLPWPDCSKTAQQSALKENELRLPGYFYNGNDPNVENSIKANFITVTNSQYIPQFFCRSIPECKADNVQVYVGAST